MGDKEEKKRSETDKKLIKTASKPTVNQSQVEFTRNRKEKPQGYTSYLELSSQCYGELFNQKNNCTMQRHRAVDSPVLLKKNENMTITK